ncbi:hypothetical protein GTW69_43210 [Streptomyces sp. SID7760]|nr:hypothetical protein [Streptomyces sp. SID7760]
MSRRVVTTDPVLPEEVLMSGTEKTKAHAEQARGDARQAKEDVNDTFRH